MNIPFLRGLTASIGSNVATLKKQAKRMHKSAPVIFGQPVSLEQCQEAIAHAIGFQRWADVSDLAIKAGADRSIPFWRIQSRNDSHATILSALTESQLELNENGAIVLLGTPENTAETAVCLWVESISARGEPGLILVNTKHQTLQDTSLGDAITSLGLREEFAQFRVIDAREKTLPVAICGTPSGWVNAITSILPEEHQKSFEATGGAHLFNKAVLGYGFVERWITDDEEGGSVPYSVVAKAARLLGKPESFAPHLLDFMTGSDRDGLAIDVQKYTENPYPKSLERVLHIVDSLAERGISLGPILWQESKHRPTVVLFSQDDEASTVIASVVHDMYYARYVMQRATRPILYFDDTKNARLPELLSFASGTVIVNGSLSRDDPEWQGVTMKRALFGEVGEGTLAFSGRKSSTSSSAA